MKNLFTVILLLILVTGPVRTSHALFGQKQARYEAELQAAQAQDEVKKTKRKAEEAITKAGEERERTDWTFGGIIVLLIEVPGGTPADDAILDYAHRHGTPIISNDLYRDYKASYQWLENASRRRVPFVVHPTMVQLHRLGMEVKTPVSLNTAINEFSSLFETVSLNRQDNLVTAHSAPFQPA